MPKPRKELVSLEATPYYHCVSRCVRRAFLCGFDQEGRSFEHRRGWIEPLLLEQAQVFAIDIAAYAVMSNHFHVVLHVAQSQAASWSVREVIERWHRLYKGNAFTQRYLLGEALSSVEEQLVEKYANEWRERLTSISWFMRRLNETIARMANEEDECTGHFWEGRFKSQALLDEKALAACMAYVDLNPVRAGMADTPEASDYTSIKKRSRKAQQARSPNHPFQQVPELFNFAGNPRESMPEGIPMKLTDYIDLVDWTGRQIRDDKRGYIDQNLPPALLRLGIDPQHWLVMTQQFESQFKGLVGSTQKLKAKLSYFLHDSKRHRTSGIGACQQLLT